MPVEFLVGVLVLSVVANGALLVWLARADHVSFHWPFGADPTRSNWTPNREQPPTRRRALFVAGESPTTSSGRQGIPVSPGTAGSAALPPELAQLLGNQAPLAGRSEASTGLRPAPQDGIVRVRHNGPNNTDEVEMLPDPLTGLESPESWSRIVEVENARLLRYRRPSTIVVAEVDGLRKLAERMGDEPVARVLPVIADAFRTEARGSDWIARVGYGRFAAFLAETDEIAAINYVERIRQICEPWLSSSAIPLRLAIGWSSPSGASDLEFAIKRAEERMHSDRRLPAKLPPPRTSTPRVVALPSVESEPEVLTGPVPTFVDPDSDPQPMDGAPESEALP